MQKEEMQKVTVMLPKRLVEKATQETGLGITPAIRQGLESIISAEAFKRLRLRRGKVKFSINIDEMREDRD